MFSVRRVCVGVVWGLVGMALLTVAISANAQTKPNPPRWVFEPPPAQSGLDHTFAYVSTIVAQVGVPHDLCWYNPVNSLTSTKESTALTITYRRYRIQGGVLEEGVAVPYSKWIPEKTKAGVLIPRKYCMLAASLPKEGHWAFEAKICRVPVVSEAESCSTWMPSVRPYATGIGGGTTQGVSRGWWIYAYDGSLSTSRT